MSAGAVRDASQYMTPVGMKKNWNAASPIARFVGGGNRAASPLNTAATTLLPAPRPTPLPRLPSEDTGPRCWGGLTSTISANQFGELAEVSPSATNAASRLTHSVGSAKTWTNGAPGA